MSKERSQLREQLDELRFRLKHLSSFTAHAEQTIFQNWVEEQIKLRRDKYELSPAQGVDDLVSREFERGETAALRLCLEYANTLEETLRKQLEVLNDTLKLYNTTEEEES